MKIYGVTAGFWFAMCLIAVLFGAIRGMWLLPRFGDRTARQWETLVLCGLFCGMIRWFIGALNPTATQAWTLGVMWLTLTLAFEFGVGRFLMRKSWADLLSDYNVLQGRLWALVLLTLLTAPYLFARFR